MNYKRRYKLALERAKKLYEQGTITESLGFVFPELRESEDERVRKWLEELIEAMPDNSIEFKELKRIDVLLWLERQGEKTTDKIEPNPAWSEEDEEMLKWLCRIIHTQRLDRAITLKEESELGEWIDKWLNYNLQTKQSEKKLTENAELQNYIFNVNQLKKDLGL